MKRFTCIFLVAFLADGLLSLATVALPALTRVQNNLAFAVFLAAALLQVAMMFSARLPKRYLLPATLFTLWCGFTNSFPVPLFIEKHAELVIALAQCVLGSGLLVAFKRFTFEWTDRPAFTWSNFFKVGALNFLVVLVVSTLLIWAGVSAIETKTAGYVVIRPGGISLEERWFERTDGKVVRLIGMVHVANAEFYESLTATLPAKDSAIVLLEGITDRNELLQKNFSYSNLAQALGVTSQTESKFMINAEKKSFDPHAPGKPSINKDDSRIQYWRADVDLSDFQLSTLEYLEAMGDLLSSNSLGEVVEKLTARSSPLKEETDSKIFWADVVDLRNKHLLEKVSDALGLTDIVIVPWGALHMPIFEQQLKDWGFEETHRVRRMALNFRGKVSVEKSMKSLDPL